MNRREFLVRLGGTLVAVPVLLEVVSCGKDSPAAPAHVDQVTATAGGSGHTHNATVTCSEVAAGVDLPSRQSTAGGSPSHQHTVPLLHADLVAIASGGVVTITTNDIGHTHDWVFQKPSNAC